MTRRQMDNKAMIETISGVFGVDPKWAVAVAMTESSLGERLISPTGCRGIFQMSMIAMKDLWLEMGKEGEELTGIICGIAFMHLLKRRWGSEDEATNRFCNPADRGFYLERVKKFMEQLDAMPA